MFSQHTSRRDFLLVVCASVSWGTIGIANQALYASGATNALSLTFFRLAIATPLFFLASWMRLGRSLFHIKHCDLAMMMAMGCMMALSQACYVAAIPSAGVYTLFQTGIRSLSATVASIVIMCEPLTAAVLAWVLFREELGTFGLLGAGCLLTAMAVILLVPRKYFEKGK